MRQGAKDENTHLMRIQQQLRDLWGRLTRPHARVQGIEQRRQSHVLNVVLVFLLVGLVFVTVVSIERMTVDGALPVEVYFLVPLIAALAVAYAVNLRGYYRASAYLLLVAGYLAVVAYSVTDFSGLTYLLTWALLIAMFLSGRALWVGSGITIVTILAYTLVSSGERTWVTPFFALNFAVVTLPVLGTYVWNRAQIERERRAELETANALLRESEAELERRVEERTAELETAYAATEAALGRAVEADRLKSQFLASMSHELRTPLNSILTFTELMQMGTFGPVNAEQVDYLGKSLQSGRHLLSLINDVLDITKIQSGMMKLFVEDDFDVAGEVHNVAETAQRLLGDKPVQIVVDVDAGVPPLTCDKRRVRQVLLNLMANAVKFTEQGTITLSVKKQPCHLLFAVMDTGPGIAPDQHELIFEPFIQTENGVRHAGGTGLGLPISKRIVESHGGDLWVESTPGDGSDFYFTLPRQAVLDTGEQEMAAHA